MNHRLLYGKYKSMYMKLRRMKRQRDLEEEADASIEAEVQMVKQLRDPDGNPSKKPVHTHFRDQLRDMNRDDLERLLHGNILSEIRSTMAVPQIVDGDPALDKLIEMHLQSKVTEDLLKMARDFDHLRRTARHCLDKLKQQNPNIEIAEHVLTHIYSWLERTFAPKLFNLSWSLNQLRHDPSSRRQFNDLTRFNNELNGLKKDLEGESLRLLSDKLKRYDHEQLVGLRENREERTKIESEIRDQIEKRIPPSVTDDANAAMLSALGMSMDRDPVEEWE